MISSVLTESSTLGHQQRLSGPMRESLETGAFWVNYAARKSWAFDAVFWSWIDAKYFGEGDWFNDRIQLLGKVVKDLCGDITLG